MNTEFKISTILTVIAIVVPVASVLIAYYYKSSRIAIDARLLIDYPVYISALAHDNNHGIRIHSVATWFETVVYNNTDETTIITEVYGSPPIGSDIRTKTRPAYKYLNKDYEALRIADPIKLPISIASRSSEKFYNVIDITIPEQIGRIMTDMYMKSEGEKLRHLISDSLSTATNNFHTSFDPKKDARSKFESAILIAPLQILDDESDIFCESPWGTIPGSVIIDIRNYINDPNHSIYNITTPKRFYVKYKLSNGKILKRAIDTDTNPLWFASRLNRMN